MFTTFVIFALPFAFTLFVACALTVLVSGIVLWVFRARSTNEALQHPYLKQQSFDRYPLSIRASIFMDYFFRLCFPKSTFWIVGQANRLLAHIQPTEVSTRIKWPLIGFWGGCFLGLIAMVTLWSLLLLTMKA